VKLLPSIDLENGEAVKRVRGVRGTGLRLGDPLALAEHIASYGFKWIHVVDLDGAEKGAPSPWNLSIVEKIANDIGVGIEFGGGIRSIEAAVEACSKGVRRLVIGSAWLHSAGFLDDVVDTTGCQVLAAVEEDSDGRLLSRGWREKERLSTMEALRLIALTKADGVFYTQVWVEGSLGGPRFERVRSVRKEVKGLLIYSGGVSSIADLEALEALRVDGVVVGMALYSGKISWEEAARYA
jgi:phosphoribosylformimino-5-aminoimidazole carboxamide ribotide isomerase